MSTESIPNKRFFFALACGFLASVASQATVNDLPVRQYSCREAINGVLVADGAKTLTVSRDQFGNYNLDVIQKDSFNGNKKLVDHMPIEQQDCRGFVPCALFKGQGLQGSDNLEFFVNELPKSSLHDAHLEIKNAAMTLSADFLCKKL